MQHPRWREGRLSTGFIADEFAGGFKAREPAGEELVVLSAVAAAIDHLGNARRREITDQMSGPPVRFATRRIVRVGTARQTVEVEGALGTSVKVSMIGADGKAHDTLDVAAAWWPGDPVWFGSVRERDVAVQVRPILNGYTLSYRGINAPAYVYTEREAALADLMPEKVAADMSKFLLCPMPGLVKAVHVEAGQDVKAGDPLCVVEAMKMENVLRAERDGRVKAVKAKSGDSLAVDAVIMEFA
jgi:propionyl-CoA carboxylase alpha chain